MPAKTSAGRRWGNRVIESVCGTVTWIARLLFVGALLVALTPTLCAATDRDDHPDPVALWAAVQDAGITLESGLAVVEQRGRPVSANFDIADGDLQLVIWIETIDGLRQVVVDPNTAAIVRAEPINASDDLADAIAQKAAMDKARISLRSAVQQALRDNVDARVLEARPELKEGHAIAVTTLLVNGRFRRVSKWLE